MNAYVAETYLSHNKKWLELKTLSTLAEAEEFLCEHFDNIVHTQTLLLLPKWKEFSTQATCS